ncbi:MAG: hypothetical protein R3C68_10975 [Myxococcota bacterium]
MIVFNASISATPSSTDPQVFTNDIAALVPALNNLAEADTLTDYQGALAIAFSGVAARYAKCRTAYR